MNLKNLSPAEKIMAFVFLPIAACFACGMVCLAGYSALVPGDRIVPSPVREQIQLPAPALQPTIALPTAPRPTPVSTQVVPPTGVVTQTPVGPLAFPTAGPAVTPFLLPTLPPASSGGDSGGCCKMCSTGKACGNSCISKNYTCHQPPGCAC